LETESIRKDTIQAKRTSKDEKVVDKREITSGAIPELFPGKQLGPDVCGNWEEDSTLKAHMAPYERNRAKRRIFYFYYVSISDREMPSFNS